MMVTSDKLAKLHAFWRVYKKAQDIMKPMHLIVSSLSSSRRLVMLLSIHYRQQTLHSANTNIKLMWRSPHKLLGKNKLNSSQQLMFSAHDHHSYIDEKIRGIRNATSSVSLPLIPWHTTYHSTLPAFTGPTTSDDIAPTNQCCSDPFNTWLHNDSTETPAPILTLLPSTLLSSGQFPGFWTLATIILHHNGSGQWTWPVSASQLLSKI